MTWLRLDAIRPTMLALFCVASIACGRLDSEVQADVRARLDTDPVTAPLELSVAVRRGVVYLAGETTTRAEQEKAAEIARSVEGVSEIRNDLRLSDQVVVEAVKQALAGDPLVGKVPIDVDAKRGMVRLMSEATNREERERAVALAKAVDGVAVVEDRMR